MIDLYCKRERRKGEFGVGHVVRLCRRLGLKSAKSLIFKLIQSIEKGSRVKLIAQVSAIVLTGFLGSIGFGAKGETLDSSVLDKFVSSPCAYSFSNLDEVRDNLNNLSDSNSLVNLDSVLGNSGFKPTGDKEITNSILGSLEGYKKVEKKLAEDNSIVAKRAKYAIEAVKTKINNNRGMLKLTLLGFIKECEVNKSYKYRWEVVFIQDQNGLVYIIEPTITFTGGNFLSTGETFRLEYFSGETTLEKQLKQLVENGINIKEVDALMNSFGNQMDKWVRGNKDGFRTLVYEFPAFPVLYLFAYHNLYMIRWSVDDNDVVTNVQVR